MAGGSARKIIWFSSFFPFNNCLCFFLWFCATCFGRLFFCIFHILYYVNEIIESMWTWTWSRCYKMSIHFFSSLKCLLRAYFFFLNHKHTTIADGPLYYFIPKNWQFYGVTNRFHRAFRWLLNQRLNNLIELTERPTEEANENFECDFCFVTTCNVQWTLSIVIESVIELVCKLFVYELKNKIKKCVILS